MRSGSTAVRVPLAVRGRLDSSCVRAAESLGPTETIGASLAPVRLMRKEFVEEAP